jgi:hypothetical protein
MASGPTYTLIATANGTASSGLITFTSIPSSYTDLVVVCLNTNISAANLYVTFNGDAGAHYSETYFNGNGSSAISGRDTVPYLNRATTIGTTPVQTIIQIMNYANTSFYKTAIAKFANSSAEINTTAILYRGSTGSSTEAITSIQLNGTTAFTTLSTFSLYGIASA